MKKILIVIGALRIGGAEKITTDFILNMDREGLDFYFLVFGEDTGEYEEILRYNGCKIIHISPPAPPYLKYAAELKEVWNKYNGFDIVHTHTLLNNGINIYIFKKLGCKRLISHSHSTSSNRSPGFVMNVYEKMMKKMIRKYATDYLACGVAAGEYLYGKELFDNYGTVINNGVDFEKFCFDKEARESLRQKYDIKDMFVIGMIARLTKVKNHTFLIDVFDNVNKLYPKSRLVIIGDGDQRETIEERIKALNLKDKVLMPGNRNDIYLLQNMIDVTVYPSHYEGLPVALVEAQVNGIPCVLSDAITREVQISEKVQFLSLQKSAEEWAKAVLEYKDVSRADNPLNEKGKNYDIKKSAEKLREIYLNGIL
ncbi:MAG: glycosyltransferase [Oscillospiraceae bacterium]|nr:glycosyltransferase [Oscillospiraceae bacterium]